MTHVLHTVRISNDERVLYNDTEILAEFILKTSNPPRRIIRQADNSSKYKSEDEFCSIICLNILSGKRPRENGNIAKIYKPVPLMWKLRQKTVYVPSRYKFRDGSSV